MGDLGWPAADLRPDPRHAVELLRDVLHRRRGCAATPVTLVPTAPLTNIALLLRTYPAAPAASARSSSWAGRRRRQRDGIRRVQRLPRPGGGRDRARAAADLAIPVTMYGLDVFYDPVVTGAEAAELVASVGRGAAELAGRLIQFQCERFGRDAATIGDAGAVCAVLDPAG